MLDRYEQPRVRPYWLLDLLSSEQVLPALSQTERADVAIVGGGFVGLWTALNIKARAPGTDVVVLEQDVCGGGASGRNGGFVLSWWSKLPTLVKLYGLEDGVEIARQCEAAANEIGTYCREHRLEVDYNQGGWLWTATATSHVGSWEPAVSLTERAHVNAFTRLTVEEIAARTGSDRHIAGVLQPSAATVHPGKLARALRLAALNAGVRVYERSRVVAVDRTEPVRLRTPAGAVVASRAVIATNAWASALRELRNSLVVVSSDLVVTPPIPDRLEKIGWTHGEAITDSQMMVDFYRTTTDGRIAFGKGGWGIALGARIGAAFDRSTARRQHVAADFHRTYPSLADVPIAHDWSGPIDRSVDGLPLIGHLGGRRHLIYGVGWSGNGVGPSVIGAKIMTSLVLETDDQWSRNPLVDRRVQHFPPEPVRFVGAHLVREGVRRKERAELAGRSPSRVASALARFAPAGIEDH